MQFVLFQDCTVSIFAYKVEFTDHGKGFGGTGTAAIAYNTQSTLGIGFEIHSINKSKCGVSIGFVIILIIMAS